MVAFGGCNKIKDATTIKVSTEFKSSILVPITTVGMKSFNLTAVGNSGSFSQSQDLTLESNVDLAPLLERVKAIDIKTVSVSIPNLGSGQAINPLTLNVTGVGVIFTQNNITSTQNNPFTPVIAAGILDDVSAKLTKDRKITLTVSGNTTGITSSFNVVLTIGADVIVYTIN